MSLAIPSVLLDLDGTLIDSQPGILASCKAALRALGHEPAPLFDLAAAIGPPIDDVMRLLLAPYGDDRVAEAVVAYREHYGERGLFESAAYPGIAEALRSLSEAGAMLYVATSKRTAFARRSLLPPIERSVRSLGVAGRNDGEIQQGDGERALDCHGVCR